MLAIRLNRIGRKHQPSYRLVVSERRSKLGGPPVEDLGFFNPFTKTFAFKQERVKHWLGIGAKPTVTVHNLLVKQGVISGPKFKVSMKKAEVKSEEAQSAGDKLAENVPEAVSVTVAEPEAVSMAESKTETASEQATA